MGFGLYGPIREVKIRWVFKNGSKTCREYIHNTHQLCHCQLDCFCQDVCKLVVLEKGKHTEVAQHDGSLLLET